MSLTDWGIVKISPLGWKNIPLDLWSRDIFPALGGYFDYSPPARDITYATRI